MTFLALIEVILSLVIFKFILNLLSEFGYKIIEVDFLFDLFFILIFSFILFSRFFNLFSSKIGGSSFPKN